MEHYWNGKQYEFKNKNPDDPFEASDKYLHPSNYFRDYLLINLYYRLKFGTKLIAISNEHFKRFNLDFSLTMAPLNRNF